jgi:hypothetical protein
LKDKYKNRIIQKVANSIATPRTENGSIDTLAQENVRHSGYSFRPVMKKQNGPPLRGPMLAGKCLDKFTASERFFALPHT